MTAADQPEPVASPARRGDFLILEERSAIASLQGLTRVDLRYRLGRITGVARDGRATSIVDGRSTRRVGPGARTWLVAAARVDTVELTMALDERAGEPFETLDDARAFVARRRCK